MVFFEKFLFFLILFLIFCDIYLPKSVDLKETGNLNSFFFCVLSIPVIIKEEETPLSCQNLG